MSRHSVEVCSPAEAKAVIDRLKVSPSALPGLAARIEGFVEAFCREPDGRLAWEIHQPNAFTDYGLRRFFNGWDTNMDSSSGGWSNHWHLFLSPSTEPASIGRYTLADDGETYSTQVISGPFALGSSAYVSGGSASYNTSTLTWSFSYTFAASGTRKIGTIGIGANPYSASYFNDGMHHISCYTVLSPAKTQTSLQTVECIYRLTLVPIY